MVIHDSNHVKKISMFVLLPLSLFMIVDFLYIYVTRFNIG